MRAVDTNMFVFHLVDDRNFGKRASEIVANIDKGEKVFIPLAVFKEILFALLKRGKTIQYLI